MSTAFDPYHRWLGISPKDQPPDHYRLLGVDRFEADLEVIHDAAERQMSHVRRYGLGQHSALSQRILNELGTAKACLLDAKKKSAYDERLRAKALPVEEVRSQPEQSAVPPLVTGEPSASSAGNVNLNQSSATANGEAWLETLGTPAVVASSRATGSFAKKSPPPRPVKKPPAGKSARLVKPRHPRRSVLDALLPRRLDAWLASLAGQRGGRGYNLLRAATLASPFVLVGVVVLVLLATFGSSRKPDPPKPSPPNDKKPAAPALAIAPFGEEEAKAHRKRWAEHLKSPQTISNSIGMQLALIPPGEFLMGSPDSDSEARSEEEKPQHRVQITKPFYLGVYEVTQGEFQKVMGSNPSNFNGLDDSLPVENVSWDDAQAFCKRLSELSEEQAAGRRYRLPTEAEWESACRAGSSTKYTFGESVVELGNYAWYDGNSGNKTHPVGTKQPNAWGLYDTHGNVWEWCEDWYGSYTAGTVKDPTGPSSASHRVSRGCSWRDYARGCRSAFRYGEVPAYRNFHLGFRVALVPSGPYSSADRNSGAERSRTPHAVAEGVAFP